MCTFAVKGQKIITEEAAFKVGDRFPAWCARVYLPEPWVCDVAYGESEQEAVDTLMRRATVQSFVESFEKGEVNDD